MGLLDRILKGADEARAGKGAQAPPPSGAPSSAGAGYDEVTAPAPVPGGEPERWTKQQFESMPLEKRVRLLVQGTLRFYRNGQEIPANQAMRSA